MKFATTICTILVFIFSGLAMAQEDPMKGPWQTPEFEEAFHRQTAYQPDPLAFFVKLHRHYISPIDGSRCPMYPSCSQYSLACFERHGLFMGWVMTWDRLYRCGRDELQLSSWVVINGERKCYDPVENNDFWRDDTEEW